MNILETPGKKLDRMYNTYLKVKGVRLPIRGRLRCALVYLVANMNKFNHIDDIKAHVSKFHKLTGTDPLQVRHLSTQYGFHIIKEGKYKHKLVTLETPMLGFIPEVRSSSLTNYQWDTMLQKDYTVNGIPTCVNCPNQQGKPLRWKQSEMTIIQKGHCDPRKPLSLDNCIPQCQYCNQAYRNKFVFNKKGLIIELL